MVIHPFAKFGMPMSKSKDIVKTQKLQVGHENKIKACKLDLEVKGQGRMGFMNVCDTLRHGDTPMCEIW